MRVHQVRFNRSKQRYQLRIGHSWGDWFRNRVLFGYRP